MIEPTTPEGIEARIRFHETGAAFYAQHAETHRMEKWSLAEAARWRQKLEALQAIKAEKVEADA
jgi:hypothetical protein